MPESTALVGPKPHNERRQRRKRVAALLLENRASTDIYEIIEEEFGIQARAVRQDIRVVREYWFRYDRKTILHRRGEILRQFRLAFNLAMAKGHVGAAVAALIAECRILGFISATTINQDNRLQAVLYGTGRQRDGIPEGIMDEVRELWRLTPKDRYAALLDKYGSEFAERVNGEKE